MLSAAIRVLARAATIQLEEAAAAHPRPPPTLLKGKERAIPLRRHDVPVPETDLGLGAAGSSRDPGSGLCPQTGKPVQHDSQTSGLQEQFGTITSEVPETLTRDESSEPRDTKANHARAQSVAAPDIEAVDRLSTTDHATSATVPSTEQVARTSASTPASDPSTLSPPPINDLSAHARDTVIQGNPTSSIGSDVVEAGPATPVNREDISPDPVQPVSESTAQPVEEAEDSPVVLRASKVPSSRIGRLFHYGSLAASMSWGAASEGLRRTAGGTAQGGSVFMSDANIRRLVATLGRMRGAALKLGQFMSIQDNHMLPPEIERVLQQVQAHANYMPDWQMEQVMSAELGADWQKMFSSFDRIPIASASIGQVHRGVMADTGLPVAVKIQFPGIASSITSDLSNLSILLRSSALLPKGLYLQNTIAVMKRELEDECDYIKEAEAGRRFRTLLKDHDFFRVPKVVDQASTSKVLTVEWMEGKPLSRIKGLSQEARDQIGENVLRLCLLELFKFRFMQTDPNWANFLYDTKAQKLGLIDFGASREYTKEFMDGWYRLLYSALKGDRHTMKVESENLGYLTGEENEMMVKAHLDSMALVASPFHHAGPYAFAQQTITSSVRSLIPIMLAHRLTPPPQETYSLNRKLSGAFLMCAKLESRVDCAKLWQEVVGDYKQGPA